MYNQAVGLGAQVKLEKAIEIRDSECATTTIAPMKEVVTDANKYACNAVIIATGAKNRPLGVDREKELIGAGISYCATCELL